MKYLFLLITSVYILSLTAQDINIIPDYQKKFKHLDTKVGLSHNRILDVFQDRYGFIWIATIDGLNRYDGYEFLVLKHVEDDSSSLSSNLVTSIAEDIYGNLWVGTEFGLNKYNRKQNSFEHIFDEDGLKNNHIRALLADEKGSLWIETVDGHLHQLHIRSGIIESFKHDGTNQPYYHYHALFKQNDTTIWVGGRNQEVQRFNPQSGNFTYYRSTNSYEYGKRVNDVSHYFEDSKGQMWVSGLDGVYQFNPKNGVFKLFLKGSTFHIFEDDHNHLWFGTGNGIYIYDREKNVFSHIISDVNNINSLSNRNVNKIIQDRSGVIWVATNGGLNIYSPKLHQFSHFYHIPENDLSISGRVVTALVEDGEHLWVGTKEEGLNRFNTTNGRLKKYNLNSHPATLSNRISNLYLDENKHLWIAHWSGKGMERLLTEEEKISKYRIDPGSTNVDWYHQIISGNNNDLLLGVWGGYGLYGIDKTRNQLKNLGKDLIVVPNEPSISALNCENDSIWWLGGENGRLRFFLPSQSAFFTVQNLFSDKPGFQDLNKMEKYRYIHAKIPDFDKVKDIIYRNDTSFFICNNIVIFYAHRIHEFGSFKDSPGYFSEEEKKLSKDLVELNPINTDSIIGFIEKEEYIYCISKSKLFEVDINTQKAQQLQFYLPHELDMSDVLFHSISNVGNSLVIATNKGLFVHNLFNSKTKYYRSKSKEFMSYPVHLLTSIARGNEDDYWLGTTSTGIARWFPKEQKIINYISDEFDSTAFWGWDVSFIYKDTKNRIWAGGNGLHLLNEEDNSFIHYTIDHGLPSNLILGAVEDKSGRLWLNTENGLSCFYIEEETFINYNEAVGLPEKEMTAAIILLKDARIAAGTKNGFIVFHPDSLIANHYIPPVLLTEFQVINGASYQDLSEIDSIELQADENHIAFSFSSLDYNNPLSNKYQYKLSGVDEEWISADAKSRWINYSNLQPGAHLLQLRGSNNNDIWNNNGKSLYIYIKPHFYEQWWFYVLVALFIVFVIVMIIIYRVRELNLQTKSAQLEQKFLRSQMNPHFIFNSLGAIQNYIFKNEPLEAATYLSDFSNLVRKILNNSRQDLIPLEEEVETLKQYLELQKLRFNDKFDYELNVDENFKESDYKIPPMLAQPFIENSIEHAFKGMNDKGQIKICFELTNNYIILICRDNGMGIKAALEQKKEGVKKHQSLATKITHDRIRVISKVYKTKINLNIQDLKEVDSSKQGTQVIIEIPIDLKKK